MKNKIILIAVLLISFIFLTCCNSKPVNDTEIISVEIDESWKEILLTDVNTNEEIKVSDFEGKPILLESFAVWCSTCKLQQDQIKEFHEEVGESVISISLNTDSNEDIQTIQEHTSQYGYDWYYVISPVDLTNSLIDQYGVSVVNAPSAPIILICEDQTTRFLESGVKDVNDLKEALNQGC
ncbi:TlpA family protein disulfide reductase [Patescibacteria group bacterium]